MRTASCEHSFLLAQMVESTLNTGDLGSVPGWGRWEWLHPSIFVWRILCAEEPGSCSP